MLEEEAEHLARGIGPAGISVGASLAPTGPSVAATVDHPLLENGLAISGGVQGAAVGMPAGHLSTLRPDLQTNGCRRLCLIMRGKWH
jgi:ABC-type cobalamin transport system permease subunit